VAAASRRFDFEQSRDGSTTGRIVCITKSTLSPSTGFEFFNGTDNQGTKAASQSGCKIDFGDVVHDMRPHLGNTTHPRGQASTYRERIAHDGCLDVQEHTKKTHFHAGAWERKN